MKTAMEDNFDSADIVIMCAAVADFRPKNTADNKLKKANMSADNMCIELESTDDILKSLKDKKKNQFVCGFSMETENMIDNSKAKLESKNLDMICANNVKEEGAGFGTGTNIVTLITKNEVVELPLASKDQVAFEILNKIAQLA